MIINSGTLKNLRILVPDTARPTSQKIRNALIHSIKPRLLDAKILDLCAGSGAVGIHAISEGAKQATFVDISLQAIRCIQQNTMSIRDRCVIHKQNAMDYIKNAQDTFDIIFIDPPFTDKHSNLDHSMWKNILTALIESKVCSPGGIIIIELHNRHIRHQEIPYEHLLYNTKKYGDEYLCFYKPILS